MIARNDVSQHFFIGVTDMRRRIRVIDRRGDEKDARHFARPAFAKATGLASRLLDESLQGKRSQRRPCLSLSHWQAELCYTIAALTSCSLSFPRSMHRYCARGCPAAPRRKEVRHRETHECRTYRPRPGGRVREVP